MKIKIEFRMRVVQNIFYCAILFAVFDTTIFANGPVAQQSNDLLSLSLNDLMNIKISSVSKREEVLSDAAASIYVITQNDIHNAGATTLSEALRLAPTLQVARITSSQYAISARGFNNLVSNKLLVLVDGRTVYTPLFSGVFWDQQDILMEDIDRIEVISGPGATLWGSNAVNGVINIITRNSIDSSGLLFAGETGNFQRGFRTRYGNDIGDNGHFGFYGKFYELDHTQRANNSDPKDAFHNSQIGFRSDWTIAQGQFTLQGDAYQGETEDRGTISIYTLGAIEVAGNNILARWHRQWDDGSHFQMQMYWDHTERRDAVLFQPLANIIDLESQYGFTWGGHRILTGGGYRFAKDNVDPGIFATFVPNARELDWENIFVQDELQFSDSLKATVGIKLEHNDYSGREFLPNARLAWKYSEQSLIWTAISRAVRAPSRYDREVFFPAPPNSVVVGGPNFKSEVANVFELGYRSRAWDRIAYSVTAYYHDWDKLRSGTAIPVQLENKIEGDVYGLEFWGTYDITNAWKLSAGGTHLNKDLRLKPDSTDPVGIDNDTLANDPKYQFQIRSTLDINDNSLLEISVLRVAMLPRPYVPSYTTIDANYHWNIKRNFELFASAKNLANQRHIEFGQAVNASEFGATAYLGLRWQP